MRERFPVLLFCTFLIGYFFLFGPYGYNDADDGYVISYSWRIYNGEIPYKDFIFTKPPLSPFFHSLTFYLFPDNYYLLAERFLFYLLAGLGALFCSLSLHHVFNFRQYHFSPYLLATLGFVFSVRTCAPTAWPTTDAVFFASVGIYLLVRFSSFIAIAGGIMLLCCAALCKQSFYLMPFAGIAFVIITSRSWKTSAVAVLSMLLTVNSFLMILSATGALTRFTLLTTGVTNLHDLFNAGVLAYFFYDSMPLVASLCIFTVAFKISSLMKSDDVKSAVPYLSLSVFLLWPLANFAKRALFSDVAYHPEMSDSFRDDTAKALFVLTILYFIVNFSFEKKWLSLLLLTVLSWSAGISWGYVTPAYFSTPLLFAFLLFSHQFFFIRNLTKLAAFLLLAGTITYFVAYQKPYCNPKRNQLTYKLDTLFPRLSGIYVGQDTYEKYHDFKHLHDKYGNNFKTLPGMPLSNYLTGTDSPLSIDWVYNIETNNQHEEVIQMLTQKKTTAFVEKHPQLITITDREGKFNSYVTSFVKKNWVLVESTSFFDVYQSVE